MNILVVIPARGGSKGIPRKNLRLLNGKPLIFYAITTALESKFQPDVYVSSEDDEILSSAALFGAKIHKRDLAIADDKSTLDPVIYACFEHAEKTEKKTYDYVITMQPTSPLLQKESLDAAIQTALNDKTIETVISAKDNTHLSWRRENGAFVPNYEKRVNRQYLTPTFVETGGFFITRRDIITPQNRIGEKVELFVLDNGQEIDIDTYDDWNICEYHIRKKHLLFVVTGNNTVGLGHVYNTLIIANDILNHKISFLVDKDSRMAFEKIASKNYPVHMQSSENIVDDIRKIGPDVVVNDRLDTTAEYVQALRAMDLKVVNFEDLGPGASKADLVINAIYPEKQVLKNHYFGHDYFVLRDEFIYAEQKTVEKEVRNILITFGGVDPNNYTKKVLDAIYGYCIEQQIGITVITGFGYDRYDTLEQFPQAEVQRNVSNISSYMLNADLIFTSAGRTTFEIASIATPAIVLAQNERELTHFFASSEFGFLNMGLGYNTTRDELFQNFKDLAESFDSRLYMSELMKKKNLKKSREVVIKLIQNLINE